MQQLSRLLAAAIVLAAVIGALPAKAATDVERQKAIIELMELTNSTQMIKQIGASVAEQMKATIRQQKPEISDKVIEVFAEEVRRGFNEESGVLLAHSAQLYEKHFTHDDIKQMIAFYKTPIGQKTLKVLPQIVGESMRIGQQWAEQVAPKVIGRATQRLKEMGYEL
ncbi:MAG: DUF2059 domain-containing protein [Rhodospirillales bacterium]|nr:DUF2059 domain-containing protein [Rhodospirillales bacterium]